MRVQRSPDKTEAPHAIVLTTEIFRVNLDTYWPDNAANIPRRCFP